MSEKLSENFPRRAAKLQPRKADLSATFSRKVQSCHIFQNRFIEQNADRWYVEINGRQINLGVDKEEAFRIYHELMSSPVEEAEKKGQAPTLVVDLMDRFLEWVNTHQAPRTYSTYMERLQSFIDYLTQVNCTELRVEELRPFHVQQWVDSHSNWNGGMKRGRMSAVQRVFNWAVKQGYVTENPVRYVEKPPQGKRENVITPECYEEMKCLIPNVEFLDLITVAWEVGCRPQEILKVEARHVDLENTRWVFPKEESKGKRRIRIVYLTETALAITQKLMKKWPEGKLFRNTKGEPWKPYSVNCAFIRLQKKVGRKFALVDFRHSFCQRALKNGVDPVSLAYLMGHVDTSMISRVYSHLSQDPEYLQKSLGRANGKNS